MNSNSLRRDGSAADALLFDLPEGQTHLVALDRELRDALNVVLADTVGAMDDIYMRPGAWTQVRSAAVADARARIDQAARAAEGARRVELPLLAAAIDGKRQVAPWVLENDRETREWLRANREHRGLAIEGAMRALAENPLDADALEVVRAVATTPAIRRNEIASPDQFTRPRTAYWRSIAPEDTLRYQLLESHIDTLERNANLAADWAATFAIADEKKVRELAALRDAAGDIRGSVEKYLGERSAA